MVLQVFYERGQNKANQDRKGAANMDPSLLSDLRPPDKGHTMLGEGSKFVLTGRGKALDSFENNKDQI